MSRCLSTVSILAAIALIGWCSPLTATPIPVFEYNFPASSGDLSNTAAGAVVDVSGAGNNGTPVNFPSTSLSSTFLPSGMTGESIISPSNGTAGIRTVGTSLLLTQNVAQYGGFAFDLWIYPTTTSVGQRIMSYAGTENFSLNAGGALEFNVGNSTTGNEDIKSAAGTIAVNTWYHVVAMFDTMGNTAFADTSNPGYYTVNGKISIYVNGTSVASNSSAYKNGKGDSISKPIAIGVHPNGTNSSALEGYIYDPKVYFLSGGTTPEPGTLALLATGLAGLLCYAWRKRR